MGVHSSSGGDIGGRHTGGGDLRCLPPEHIRTLH